MIITKPTPLGMDGILVSIKSNIEYAAQAVMAIGEMIINP
jgi:hypothetical protein